MFSRRYPSLLFVPHLVLFSLPTAAAAATEQASSPGPTLASLAVTAGSGARSMFPTFAADTLHYGIRCDETEKLSISATPNPETATVQVSGGGGGGGGY